MQLDIANKIRCNHVTRWHNNNWNWNLYWWQLILVELVKTWFSSKCSIMLTQWWVEIGITTSYAASRPTFFSAIMSLQLCDYDITSHSSWIYEQTTIFNHSKFWSIQSIVKGISNVTVLNRILFVIVYNCTVSQCNTNCYEKKLYILKKIQHYSWIVECSSLALMLITLLIGPILTSKTTGNTPFLGNIVQSSQSQL